MQSLMDSPFLAAIFAKTLEACKGDGEVSDTDLRTCVLWLAGSLRLSNHQRPGAVAGMVLSEESTAAERKDCFIDKNKLAKRLKQYMAHIRPCLPPRQLAFPNQKGGKLDHLSRIVQLLGQKLHLTLSTGTEDRHQAATTAARCLDEEGQQQVAPLMSHSNWELSWPEPTGDNAHTIKYCSLLSSKHSSEILTMSLFNILQTV